MGFIKYVVCAVGLALVAPKAGAQIESDRFRESLVPQGHVSDWAGVFTPDQKADLESRIAAVRQATGAQLAVVAVKSLQGGEITDFAVKLFDQSGLSPVFQASRKGQANCTPSAGLGECLDGGFQRPRRENRMAMPEAKA